MTPGGTLLAALLVTLSRPATWPLALAAFLVRGGILVILLPIVVLPTTVGLGTAFGPTLLRRVRLDPARGHRRGRLGRDRCVVWLVVGGWFAAGLEAAGAWIVAGDEEVAGPSAGLDAAGRAPVLGPMAASRAGSWSRD